MEFNLDKHTQRSRSSSDSLQRAIERNRSKRAKRLGHSPEMTAGPPTRPRSLASAKASTPRSIVSNPEEAVFEGEIRSPRKKLPADISYSKREMRKSLPKRSTPKKSLESTISESATPSKLPTRRSTTTTVTPHRRATAVKAPEKKGFKGQMVDMMVYAGWICCLILLVRLIVSDRGVWDYYSRLRHFDELQNQFYQIQDHNQALMEEIQMIGDNRSYQKKLIRDNLGFISSQEYLLLFSNKRKPTSI